MMAQECRCRVGLSTRALFTGEQKSSNVSVPMSDGSRNANYYGVGGLMSQGDCWFSHARRQTEPSKALRVCNELRAGASEFPHWNVRAETPLSRRLQLIIKLQGPDLIVVGCTGVPQSVVTRQRFDKFVTDSDHPFACRA